MPLSTSDEINRVADELVAVIREGYGNVSKKLRPVHARGQLVKGTFVPSDGAKYLSKAPIFKTASTPLLARFSCDTGYHDIPDTDVDANPRGLAVRFMLSEDGHTHYDMITNTAIGFPVNRGEGFRDMFKFKLGQITWEQLTTDWPFIPWYTRNRKPIWPFSFATELWHGIHAFSLDSEDGKKTYFRTRLVRADSDLSVSCDHSDTLSGTSAGCHEDGRGGGEGAEGHIPV